MTVNGMTTNNNPHLVPISCQLVAVAVVLVVAIFVDVAVAVAVARAEFSH